MKAQDIMTRNPACVTPNATVREAAQVMLREEVGIVPVVSDDGDRQLVGVVTDRDIVVRAIADGKDGDARVRDIMSDTNLRTCRQNEDVDSIMKLMRAEKVRRVPIVDERGGLLGIVSQADVVLKAHDDDTAERTIEEISEPGGRHAT